MGRHRDGRLPDRPYHPGPGVGPPPSPSMRWSSRSSPDHPRGRRRPVRARHRLPEGCLPQGRSDAGQRSAGFDRIRRLPGHWAKIRPQQPHRTPWAAKPGAAPTSPRVFPDSDSVTCLIGSVLPEQRGVAVRRTPVQASSTRCTRLSSWLAGRPRTTGRVRNSPAGPGPGAHGLSPATTPTTFAMSVRSCTSSCPPALTPRTSSVLKNTPQEVARQARHGG